MASKPTLCLQYDSDVGEAAHFYAATFPDSKVGKVHACAPRRRARRYVPGGAPDRD